MCRGNVQMGSRCLTWLGGDGKSGMQGQQGEQRELPELQQILGDGDEDGAGETENTVGIFGI